MSKEKLDAPSARKALGSFLGVNILYIGGIAANLRGILPEPYDVPDHLGNVMAGVFIGHASAVLGAGLAEKAVVEHSLPDIRDKPSYFRAAVASGAMVLGAIANGVVETKMGTTVNTPDSIDFIYGVVACGIFGATGPGPYSKSCLRHIPEQQQE